MLTLTPTARAVLERIPPLTGHPAGGLRIARPDGHRDDPAAGFRVATADGPRRTDVVVEDDGARVFLGPVAAERFDGRVLDVRDDAGGRVEFVVRRPLT